VSVARAPEGASPTSASQRPAQVFDDLRCFVTVSRKDETDARMRQVLVTVDEHPSRTLMFGDAFTLELEPGAHLLKANNTLFWKRVPFALEPGEHLEFVAINQPGRMALGFLTLMGVAPLYLKLEKRSVT
jgi:hypothetical protein